MRRVPCPAIIRTYFNWSNLVDVHNQARQFELALEKYWITHSGWSWLVTTMFVFVAADCWKVYCFHLNQRHQHKRMEIQEFTDMLSKGMLENNFSKLTLEDQVLHMPINANNKADITFVSALSGEWPVGGVAPAAAAAMVAPASRSNRNDEEDELSAPDPAYWRAKSLELEA